jgi:hypothetical protein
MRDKRVRSTLLLCLARVEWAGESAARRLRRKACLYGLTQTIRV